MNNVTENLRKIYNIISAQIITATKKSQHFYYCIVVSRKYDL